MKTHQAAIIGLIASLILNAVTTGFAAAQTPLPPSQNPLIGSWREQLKRGAMVVEFTKSTMSFSNADQSGQIVPNSTHLAHVHYVMLAKSIGVEFDENGGGEILVLPQSSTRIVLDFPGAGAHQLDRLK